MKTLADLNLNLNDFENAVLELMYISEDAPLNKVMKELDNMSNCYYGEYVIYYDSAFDFYNHWDSYIDQFDADFSNCKTASDCIVKAVDTAINSVYSYVQEEIKNAIQEAIESETDDDENNL